MRICPTAAGAPGLTISRTSNLGCGIAARVIFSRDFLIDQTQCLGYDHAVWMGAGSGPGGK
jgi:hypothetical protein